LNIVLIVIGLVVVVLVGALAFTEGERREGRSLPIGQVDFAAINDGTYHGAYEGGRYGWRANEVDVTVADGRVTDIEITAAANRPTLTVTDTLFARVIQAQSLKVDTVSSATITSKSFLKSIENALRTATGR
jgi:uncharacterized protein with FMN-binding domain